MYEYNHERAERQPHIDDMPKDYTEPYTTPYYDELKKHGILLSAVLCSIRTIKGRELRMHGIEVFRNRFLTPRTDGMSNTITSVQKDNLIMIKKQRQYD